MLPERGAAYHPRMKTRVGMTLPTVPGYKGLVANEIAFRMRDPLKNVHSAMILEVLETEIVSGEIAPGARLNEVALAQRFNVSRTPVREVLQNIVSRSLAERVPFKGVVVRDFKPERIRSMFEAMAEIEALCGGLAAERMQGSALTQLEQIHRQMSEMAEHKAAKDYEMANSEFHALIFRGAANDDLGQMAFDMRLKLAPFRRSQLYQVDRMLRSNQEHALIVELLRSGNRPGVEQALRQHLRGAAEVVLAQRQ